LRLGFIITSVAFRDYLEREKKYSLHTVSGYLKDVENFSLFNETHFGQSVIDTANYSQIRT
jgi:integrase/recombinase XerC